MKEYTFICPHCGKAVEVDESGYAAIIKQIRDDAFQADLEEQKRVMEMEREKAVELAKTQAAMEFREKEHELDSQMQNLRSDLKAAKENAETAAKLSANEAEQKYGAILSEKELEIAKLHEQVRSAKTDTELAVAKAEAEANKRFAKQQEVVANLKAKNEMAEAQAKLHKQELVARYEGQLKIHSPHSRDFSRELGGWTLLRFRKLFYALMTKKCYPQKYRLETCSILTV